MLLSCRNLPDILPRPLQPILLVFSGTLTGLSLAPTTPSRPIHSLAPVRLSPTLASMTLQTTATPAHSLPLRATVLAPLPLCISRTTIPEHPCSQHTSLLRELSPPRRPPFALPDNDTLGRAHQDTVGPALVDAHAPGSNDLTPHSLSQPRSLSPRPGDSSNCGSPPQTLATNPTSLAATQTLPQTTLQAALLPLLGPLAPKCSASASPNPSDFPRLSNAPSDARLAVRETCLWFVAV